MLLSIENRRVRHFSKVTLNGIVYGENQLLTLINTKLNSDGIQTWEKDIYRFINELINEKDYIQAQSSGTTGKAKQIKLRKRDLIESAIRTQNYFHLKSADNALLCLPVSYIAGKMMIVRAFVTGFNLRYVEPSSDPFKNISDTIDFTALTPYQLSLSLENKNLDKVKNIIVGGAPVSERLLQKIQNLKCNVFETYGMTETCSHIAIKPLNGDLKSAFFSILPDFNVSLDERGCLVVKLADGTKLITNDLVQLEKGYFKWLGRYDNVINSGGIKLYPEQIEKKLELVLKHEFLISSEKHETLGEQVVLILKTDDKDSSDFDINAIRNNLDGVLSSYERPKKLYLLPEFIETSNGKIKRKETINSIVGKRGYVL